MRNNMKTFPNYIFLNDNISKTLVIYKTDNQYITTT